MSYLNFPKHSTSWKFLAGIACAMGLACAPVPKYKTPRLGEVVEIKPISPEAGLALTNGPVGALKISVSWGDRPLTTEGGDLSLRFMHRTGNIRYKFLWSELEMAYRDTGCTAEEVKFLDGPLKGSAMICGGRFDLRDIVAIEGQYPGGPVRRATSWLTYGISDGVSGIVVGLY